jgi:HlyD family secretion protein
VIIGHEQAMVNYHWVGVMILLAVIYQMTQSVPVSALQVSRGNIREYIDETGTVKSPRSQTVYLNNSGKITLLIVDQGDWVRRGDLLLKLSPADLKIAQISNAQARINLESAQKDWDRAQKFFEEGAISKSDFDNAQTIYKRVFNEMRAAELTLGKEQESLEVNSSLTGMILQRSVDINQVVTPETPAFIIGDPKDLEIDVDILADDVVKIKLGNLVDISGQSTGGSVLKGKVIKAAPMAQNVVSSLGVNQKRATVTIAFLNSTGSLKPGYDVDVRVFTRTQKNVMVVPSSAVFDLQGKNYVFVIANGHTRLRAIQKGIENDDQIEVDAGLTPGEWILTKPDNLIQANMKVSIAKD